MIAWSIIAAQESNVFDRIVVSTDDEEIAEIASSFGAEIPFTRSEALANDFATTAQVILDAIEKCPGHELTACLYPTAPLLRADDINTAHSILQTRNADCVLTVCEYDFHPLRAFSKDESGNLAFNWPENELTRSQDLPELVHDAGMFYFMRTKKLVETGKILCGKAQGLELPRNRAIDIDTPEDLEIARELHRQTLQSDSGTK